MSDRGSYQIEKISGNLKLEVNRLKAQVELFWNKELKRYKEFGLRDGMSVVELGCGPGFLSEKLLREFPNINIIAVEIDPFLCETAQNYLSQEYQRFKVIEGSILNTGLEENSFDFAITRLVLEHLPDPVSAVSEINRILKPGGKAVFVDNDFEMHIMAYPNIPELRELYDAYCQSRSSEGGNPRIGRELPGILKAGGLTNIDFEVICAHSGILGDEMFFKSEGIGIPSRLVQDGFLSSKSLGKIAVNWRDMVKNEEHAIIRQLYMAVGEKL